MVKVPFFGVVNYKIKHYCVTRCKIKSSFNILYMYLSLPVCPRLVSNKR
jgi:hypothetical protein